MSHRWTTVIVSFLILQILLVPEIVSAQNNPPNNPNLRGPMTGFEAIYYTYFSDACDPDMPNDSVGIEIDWGDNFKSQAPFFNQCRVESLSHRWTVLGNYQAQATSTDTHSVSSSSMLNVSILDNPSCGILRTDQPAGGYKMNDEVKIFFKNTCSDDVLLSTMPLWSMWWIGETTNTLCAGITNLKDQFVTALFLGITFPAVQPGQEVQLFSWDQTYPNGNHVSRGCYQVQIEGVLDNNNNLMGDYRADFFTEGTLLAGETSSSIASQGQESMILSLATGPAIIEYEDGADDQTSGVVTATATGPALPSGFMVGGAGVFYNVADAAGGIARLCAPGSSSDRIFKDINGDNDFADLGEDVTGDPVADPFPAGFVCTIFFPAGLGDPLFVVATQSGEVGVSLGVHVTLKQGKVLGALERCTDSSPFFSPADTMCHYFLSTQNDKVVLVGTKSSDKFAISDGLASDNYLVVAGKGDDTITVDDGPSSSRKDRYLILCGSGNDTFTFNDADPDIDSVNRLACE